MSPVHKDKTFCSDVFVLLLGEKNFSPIAGGSVFLLANVPCPEELFMHGYMLVIYVY